MRDIVDSPMFLRLNRRNRGPKETMRLGSLKRVLIANVVSSNSAALQASIFSGIPENLIEDVKLTNCFLDHRGLAASQNPGSPAPDWRTRMVPEIPEEYPDPRRFGQTSSHGFFLRHINRLEMSHVEIAPRHPDPRPAFWLEDVHRADFFAVTAPAQQNFALRNVSDLRISWSRAAKDTTLDHVTESIV